MNRKTNNKIKNSGAMLALRLVATLLFVVQICSLFIGEGFSIWHFSQYSKNASTNVETTADFLNYSSDQIVNIDDETQKKYDVYFLAQNIDIYDFIEIDERVNALEQYKFIDESTPSHGLYYTNTAADQNITEYEPRLGTWDPNFSNDWTVAGNLFKKFENVSGLSTEEVNSIGAPYSKMVDNNSNGGGAGWWNLEFLDWTLDIIKLDYETVYERDADRNRIQYDPVTNEPIVVHDAVEDVSIYYRNNTKHTKNGNGNIQVYGTYPTEGFNLANASFPLEIYDEHAINIKGKKCLFFYPIYSLGKDQFAATRLTKAAWNKYQNADNLEDCLRSEDSKVYSTDRYTVFDREMTDLMQQKPAVTDMIKYWEMPSWTDESNRWQGWKEEFTTYKCFRFSNRYVTQEMVDKNANAKNRAINEGTRPVNSNYNLDETQLNQTYYGEYMYIDICRAVNEWEGTHQGYLIGEDNELLDINYSTGLYNVYFFVKQRFIDDPSKANWQSERDKIAFTAEEMAAIDSIFVDKGIYVDKTVSCLSYLGFWGLGGGWSHNDGRDFYVVFEKIVNIDNVSSYGDDQERNFRYSVQNMTGGVKTFISPTSVEFDVDTVTNEISTTNALTVNDEPITFTYPDYYFTSLIEGMHDAASIHNIGYGNTVGTYAVPEFVSIFSNGERIRNTFKSSEYLETIYQAITNNEAEEARLKVTLADNNTYTLAELKISQNALYLDLKAQLENVGLIKVKESGSYKLCVVLRYINDQINFDVWAGNYHGYLVTVYDSADFAGAEIQKDINGVLISKNALISNFSFMSSINYNAGENLLYGNSPTNALVKFRIKDAKVIPSQMQSYVTTTGSIKYINILDLLYYYDSIGKCLYDGASGRCITYSNVQTLPFIINKDCILTVKNKPAGIV